ncbi:putative dual specificity protein phosphatase DSP8 [Camellia sinensis]|nr:putative dual specificity protein phosphatase DSP8 [Camellia sinensis]
MSPAAALEYVRSKRPRVLLAPSQWKAVQEYKQHRLVSTHSPSGDAVLITKADLEGYHSSCDDKVSKALAVVPRVGRLSCLLASLKEVSGGFGPVPRRLADARAC